VTLQHANLTPKARRTLSSLVSAAETLIGRHGIQGVTVMSVCAEAGVGRTSFYNYFEDVGALTNVVATEAAKKIKERFDGLHVGVPRGAERLRACLGMILETSVNDANEMLLLTALAQEVQEVSDLLEAEIAAELAAEPVIQSIDIEALSRLLATALLALARQLAVGSIPSLAKDRHVEFLMRACKLD